MPMFVVEAIAFECLQIVMDVPGRDFLDRDVAVRESLPEPLADINLPEVNVFYMLPLRCIKVVIGNSLKSRGGLTRRD